MSTRTALFGADMKKISLVLFCIFVPFCFGKPLVDSTENALYGDTEEIMNEWNNDDSYYDYSEEAHQNPAIAYLPPVLVELPSPATTTTTTTTTTQRPVYFPNTDIELGPLFEQVGKARRNEIDGAVNLPVPYIVWAHDPSGKEGKINYWKRFYSTMYKVD